MATSREIRITTASGKTMLGAALALGARVVDELHRHKGLR